MFVRSFRRPSSFAAFSLAQLIPVIVLVMLGGVSVLAQSGDDPTGTGGRHSIQGRLVFPSGRRADVRLKVRLQSPSSPDLTVYTDSNGGFSFRSLQSGSYTVTIDGGKDFENFTESIYIEPEISSMMRGVTAPPISRPYTLQVYLQPKRAESERVKPGVVNAALANVPKPALDLYNKALDLARNKETWNQAIDQLRGAIALYPDFGLAYSEMGVLYLKLKQQDKALEALRAALKLIPNDYATLLTYGMILYDRREFPAAEDQFRKAIEKNHLSPSGHLYLAMTLLKRHAYEEAEKEFKEAIQYGGEDVAIAHYYLGGIYWGRKDYKEAADELDTYLKLVPNAPGSERLRATIKDLRHKQG
jgi:cytochrome c-type biogenesis protein CcmH/NrfG